MVWKARVRFTLLLLGALLFIGIPPALGDRDIKWSQPPDPAYPGNVYYGWNQFSEWCYGPLAADDWVCTTPAPVTDITWWGSFIGWKDAHPPPWSLPSHFHLEMWTDVPAQQDPDFSHPGQVLWQVFAFNYTWEFVGWDFDPLIGEYEACFKFSYALSPWKYFSQDPGAPGAIYWLSIAACYD